MQRASQYNFIRRVKSHLVAHMAWWQVRQYNQRSQKKQLGFVPAVKQGCLTENLAGPAFASLEAANSPAHALKLLQQLSPRDCTGDERYLAMAMKLAGFPPRDGASAVNSGDTVMMYDVGLDEVRMGEVLGRARMVLSTSMHADWQFARLKSLG